MRWFKLPGCLCMAVLLMDTAATAGDAEDEIRQLIQRLESAEARLQELEAGSTSVPVPPDPPESLFIYASDPQLEDTSEIDDLVQRWENNWEQQRDINNRLQNEIRKAVQSGSDATKSMDVEGRIHADYWGFPDSSAGINRMETANSAIPLGNPNATPQDRIGFRRLRFGINGDVSPNMGYKIEMEFAGGDESEFRDAYIQANNVRWLQSVVVGNHKRPYGLDHLNSSRFNVFLERPFIIEAFNQDARRLGISAQGVSSDQSWNWIYGVWNQRLIQDEGNYTSDHLQGEIAGRLANTYWYDEQDGGSHYAHWAVSGTLAHPDGSANPIPMNNGQAEAVNEARFRTRPEARSINRWLDTGVIARADWYEIIGLEKVINFGPLQLVGEYQNLFLQRDSGLGDLHLHGGYIYAAYFLTGEHMPWDRSEGVLDRVEPNANFFLADRCCKAAGTGWGALQIALRHSVADLNDGNINGGIGRATTFGLNWHWNANTRLQLNYTAGRISNRNVGGVLRSGSYDVAGARFMIDF